MKQQRILKMKQQRILKMKEQCKDHSKGHKDQQHNSKDTVGYYIPKNVPIEKGDVYLCPYCRGKQPYFDCEFQQRNDISTFAKCHHCNKDFCIKESIFYKEPLCTCGQGKSEHEWHTSSTKHKGYSLSHTFIAGSDFSHQDDDDLFLLRSGLGLN